MAHHLIEGCCDKTMPNYTISQNILYKQPEEVDTVFLYFDFK